MIQYEFTKKDFRKYLKCRRRVTNIIFILLGSLLYFCFIYNLLLVSPLEVLIFYVLYLVILVSVAFLLDEIYCIINIRKNKIYGKYVVNVSDDRIVVSIDGVSSNFLNKDIKKIVKRKKYILIRYNNGLSLLFWNVVLTKDFYEKIINFR